MDRIRQQRDDLFHLIWFHDHRNVRFGAAGHWIHTHPTVRVCICCTPISAGAPRRRVDIFPPPQRCQISSRYRSQSAGRGRGDWANRAAGCVIGHCGNRRPKAEGAPPVAIEESQRASVRTDIRKAEGALQAGPKGWHADFGSRRRLAVR
jgi:hypothetical protein